MVLAQDMKAKAIIAYTDWGLGPRLIGNWRPECEVIGFASTADAVRRMALYWGVRPVRIDAPSSLEALVRELERVGAERPLEARGATVVITTKMPFGPDEVTSLLKLHTVGNAAPPESSLS